MNADDRTVSLDLHMLRRLLGQVYFVTGTAYAGKSTLVRRLAEKHRGVMCGENYHDELMRLIDREHHPNLSYFDTMESWQAFISRTPDEYEAWVDGVSREAADLELMLLIRLAQLGRPVFVDTNIPLPLLRQIARRDDGGWNVLVMLSPQSMSVERFFDREDPEKQFLLQKIGEAPDPDAALANFRACIARVNSPERYREMAESGFAVFIRTEESTIADADAAAEAAFRLTTEEKTV